MKTQWGDNMIGDKLKELRESTGLNKKDFAASLGVKYTTYNNYEVGTREPASDFLIMISKKFDVSIDYIMGLSEEKEKSFHYELKASEYDHIEKYRDLDVHGKSIVDFILDREYARTTELKIANSPYQIPFAFRLFSQASRTNNPLDISNFKIVGLTEEPPKNATYLVRISGDIMEPEFCNGDMVYVQRTEHIRQGEIGIFVTNSKKVRLEKLVDYDELLPEVRHKTNLEETRFSTNCLGKIIKKCECEIIGIEQ